MNQNKAITGVHRLCFFCRIERLYVCLLAIAIVGSQGCDATDRVGVEHSAHADVAIVQTVDAGAEINTPVVATEPESSPASVSGADTVEQEQGEEKSKEVSNQSPEKHDEVSEEGDDSVFSQAGKFVGDAASKSVTSASEAGKWVQETLGDATETGTQSAADTWEWANETFESLKSQGLTSAQSTSQWLGQDWKNMESWQYQIVVLDGEPTEVAKRLNELGEQGWECFDVNDLTSTSTKFYFKKPTFSYLRQLPFKDVIKLVPLMNAGER
ncbi:MAG: hypothetical protein OSA89_02440 [Mariniblastus sp.]|nr:hypothetical protein [Mariniblastus sp.]